MNKTIEKYLTVTGLLFCFCLIGLSITTRTTRAQAWTFDFNDGTNQGWVVRLGGLNPAIWYDGVNYSGNPATGRPPQYGPQDDFDGSIGAICGYGLDDSNMGFEFPIFVPRPMGYISARFIISGREYGIPASLPVMGKVCYRKVGSDTPWCGPWTRLERVIHSGGVYAYPLWTWAAVAVADGDMVTQISVAIWVSETPWENTQNWIDHVIVSDVGLFGDVPPGHWAENYINAIFNRGVTKGCSQDPLRYCPQANVTRAQMAAFIVRSEEGEPGANYCSTGSPFSDVSSDTWPCKYIKRLSEMEITQGCGPGIYCPNNNVTRAEMAAFIIRAVEGEPPANYCDTGSPFSDVSSNTWPCKYIKRLSELGITKGCGGSNYCPNNNVTRAEMAAFLARAFLGMD